MPVIKLGNIFRFTENRAHSDIIDKTLSFAECKKLIEKVSNTSDYKEKLLLLFSCNKHVNISTTLYHLGKIKIDLSPSSSEEISIYNNLVREVLKTAESKNDSYTNYKSRFMTYEDFVSDFDKRVERETSDIEFIIETDLNEIQNKYPSDHKYRNMTYLDFDDSPYQNNYSIGREDIFNFLIVGNEINYKDKFINTRHHIIILQCEAVLQYYKFLKDEKAKMERKKSSSKNMDSEQLSKTIKFKKAIVSGPVISLFCEFVDEAKIDTRQTLESVEAFCKRICNKYHLEYTDRVRQNFLKSKNYRNSKKVLDLICPLLPSSIQEHLRHFIKK